MFLAMLPLETYSRKKVRAETTNSTTSPLPSLFAMNLIMVSLLGRRVVVDGRNGLLDLRSHVHLGVVVVHLVDPEQRSEPGLFNDILVDFLRQFACIGAAVAHGRDL